ARVDRRRVSGVGFERLSRRLGKRARRFAGAAAVPELQHEEQHDEWDGEDADGAGGAPLLAPAGGSELRVATCLAVQALSVALGLLRHGRGVWERLGANWHPGGRIVPVPCAAWATCSFRSTAARPWPTPTGSRPLPSTSFAPAARAMTWWWW